MAFPLAMVDQMGRAVTLPEPPQRVISLCPSLTETLVHLGLGERLVGRTRFCIHPSDQVRRIQQVGGTKEVHMERVRALQPDLIICEKEENTQAMVEALEQEFTVFMTDVTDLGSAREMILQLGAITDTMAQAVDIAAQVDASWERLYRLKSPIPCVYCIWKNPWMVVGADTFIDSVLQKCGFDNVARQWEGRYPVLDEVEISAKKNLLVLLSTEPYPFKPVHIADIQKIMPSAIVRIVDGEMFSWYGSHMIGVENYMNMLLQDVEAALYLHD